MLVLKHQELQNKKQERQDSADAWGQFTGKEEPHSASPREVKQEKNAKEERPPPERRPAAATAAAASSRGQSPIRVAVKATPKGGKLAEQAGRCRSISRSESQYRDRSPNAVRVAAAVAAFRGQIPADNAPHAATPWTQSATARYLCRRPRRHPRLETLAQPVARRRPTIRMVVSSAKWSWTTADGCAAF